MPSPIANFFVKILINSPLHALLGEDFAVISVTGRKSGRLITTPINILNVDGVRMVVSMRDRTWWRNLRGGFPARLRQSGKCFAARGEIVETPVQVAGGLNSYFMQHPGYAKYFRISLGPEEKPDPVELERVASESVLVRLFPV